MAKSQPNSVLDLIEAFRRSQTMFTALALGVFDRLAPAPATADELARALGCHPDALGRLLDACVALGLLLREGERYANSEEAARYLARSSPDTMSGYIRYSHQVLYSMWAHLDDAVREGSHRWQQTFGLDGPLFSHFFRTDEAKRDFLAGMHGLGQISSPAVVAAFDLGSFRQFVDLGGATGHLALAAAQRYPGMQAAVFDLPPVIEVAREYLAGTPVETIAGDFFSDPLPPADLYALGRILHDWSDLKIHRLLRKICDALPEHGALLIAEKLLTPENVPAHMQSLNMLICTEGRERPVAQYEALLRDAGFLQVDSRQTGTVLDAVLARKQPPL